MPTYEYKCLAEGCGNSVVLSRKVEERDEEVTCDKCGHSSSRIYNSPSIQFKGTGFYSTGG